MSAQLQPGFDRVARHALLGLQFRDAVTGRVVDQGLSVQLQDTWRPQRLQALACGCSGVFTLHAAPGLAGFARPAGDVPGAPVSPAEPPRFEVHVQDRLGRYLPLRLQPAPPFGGLWAPPLLSPASPAPALAPAGLPPHVPLFSAATRPLPPALASLRVELRRAAVPAQPVSWARLELWLGSTPLALGQADEAGRALLLFPLPRPREAALGASPAGTPPAFEWTVSLRAFWRAGLPAGPVPAHDEPGTWPEVPLLRAPAATPAEQRPLPALLLRAGATLMAQQPPESFVYVAA